MYPFLANEVVSTKGLRTKVLTHMLCKMIKTIHPTPVHCAQADSQEGEAHDALATLRMQTLTPLT